MSSKQYIIITLLLLAACIGTWVLLNELENRAVPLTNSNHPDSYMNDVIATQMDEQGKLKDELKSPLLVHFPNGNSTNITSPHFIIYNSDSTDEPWHITANYGQAHDGINIIELWDHVKLMQPAGAQNAETTMVTTAMTVFPKQQYAQTQQPVKVWQAGSVVTSVGLHADLKTGEIDLLSQARGKYQPDTTNSKK